MHRRTERQMYSMFQVTEAEILFFLFFSSFFFLCGLSGGHGIPAFLFLLPSRIFDILCHPFLFFLPLPLQYISVLSCCHCSFCPYFFSFSSHPLLDHFAFIPSPLPVHKLLFFHIHGERRQETHNFKKLIKPMTINKTTDTTTNLKQKTNKKG